MRSKHELPSKFDYMKAYSFNLIQTERTNTELEHERNAGKIDGAFYKIFAWQIAGMPNERPAEATKTMQLENQQKSNDHSNKRLQEESEVLKNSKSKVEVQTRVDNSGSSSKRYVTTCYIKPKTLPVWYTESLLIFIGSTKRKYDEKIYFKNKTQPYYWSENMTTDVNFPPTKSYLSEAVLPTETKCHYISLEPQQLAATTLR
ncbi:uncharacterized protein LOC115877643 [Sitophilus oryzae]|uniref:Uncharacterized protein LOC115877643 n=1 Tax=Sitophilus oryzae TaxID=7048 RepID=A0A6J2XG94_SITOR|nr:uncharacterized protein LOC115877643 [Sitophilus oryzae]